MNKRVSAQHIGAVAIMVSKPLEDIPTEGANTAKGNLTPTGRQSPPPPQWKKVQGDRFPNAVMQMSTLEDTLNTNPQPLISGSKRANSL